MRTLAALFALSMFAAACSSGSGTTITLDVTNELPGADIPDSAGTDTPQPDGVDVQPQDLPSPADAVDAEDGFQSCQPGEGCFLDPCDGPQDCLSGLCVDHMGDTVCTVTCVEECPAGWECTQVGAGPDAMFACLSPFSRLCRPCTDKEDCTSTSGLENVCLDFGPDGAFCGANCADSGDCPESFACQQATTVGGATLKQCVPDSGVCLCSDKSIELGLGTVCFVENEFGLCTGQRVCTEDGLSACDAPTPAAETCDGADNDCDGEVDNLDCDDEDPCTADSCDPEVGCVHEPLTGTTCDDSDVCTLADHCDNGLCIGTAIDCDDDNPCTSDTCDPAGGCLYGFNSAACDDGDPCTVNDICKQGDCVGFAVACDCQVDADCLALDDEDVCNGSLVCDTSELPYQCVTDPETVIVCPEPEGPGAECLAPACNPETGECSLVPKAEGKVCDDGDGCTIGESCGNGECAGGVALNCNDGNPCTDDGCDPETGCFHTPNEAPCEDGNLCTIQDQCQEGECLPGSNLQCDDGNVCTDDGCDPNSGCTHTANNAACDDGNACTTTDQCSNGACVGSGTLDCNDGNLCTDDACTPEGGCLNTPNANPCNDGNACTAGDTCAAGECVAGPAVTCDDGNVCTDDGCDPNSGCTHTANNAACDDGNACTTADVCANKQCTGGAALDCDDANLCTDDGCDPATGCTHTANANPCDDDNPCTTADACTEGACVGGPAPDCDDGNLCTDDGCDPATGCTHTANANPCDDGNPCTQQDTCTDKQCKGTIPLDCNDGNLCTDDSCDPVAGCQHVPNTNPCNDGNACTSADACSAGACVGGPALECSDNNPCTDDSCDAETGCHHEANAAKCDDGNACTKGDLCANGACVPGGPLDCNDDNLCTDDACDPVTGCTHAPNENLCDDGDACTTGDVCTDGLCVGPGTLDCDDGNECTADSCDPVAGCLNEAIIPCCGDGSIDGPEECDNGVGNGADGLGACSAECTLDSRYTHVMRMTGAGQVTAGSWDDAWDRVVTQGQDCIVRFDSRVARPLHIEYAANTIRFDFQPLHAYHNGWDAYAYVEVKVNNRAGIGARYRRGHASNVWQKDAVQHGEAEWHAMQVDLYCEREPAYQLISTFNANGAVTSGESFDALFDMITEQGAVCKVRYDSRISPIPHVEYTTDLLYLDFLGLHAFHDSWDAYAYIVLQKNVRASLSAAYRRGRWDQVWRKDRVQHAEAYTQNLEVDVLCIPPTTEKYTISSTGQFVQGDWPTLYQRVVTEARDCRVRFDHRVAEVAYLEYSDNTLLLEFEHLHAPHDTWEALAHVFIQNGSQAALRGTYRRGHDDLVWRKSADQHTTTTAMTLTVDLFCDVAQEREKVYEVSTAGNDLDGVWADFYGPMTTNDEAYTCKVRSDGRIVDPLVMEYGGTNAPMLFDDISLAAYHDSWDAYAGYLVQHGQQASIVASYRRGHDDSVWRKDRDQHAIAETHGKELEFLCH